MNFPWLKVLGSLVALLVGVGALVGAPMALQSRVDASQDTRIDQVEEDHRAGITSLRAADREQAKTSHETAQVLREAMAIVREIDKRGTLAGREHERTRGLHNP